MPPLSDISIDDLCFEKDYFDNNGYQNQNKSLFYALNVSILDNNN